MRKRQQSLIVIAVELNDRPRPGADAPQFLGECENRTAQFAQPVRPIPGLIAEARAVPTPRRTAKAPNHAASVTNTHRGVQGARLTLSSDSGA